MAMLKWSVRIHKWIALLIGVQILLWIAGGFIMSVVPIEQVRGEHKVAAEEPKALSPHGMVSLAELSDRHALPDMLAAETGTVLGEPVWRIRLMDGRQATFSARTGAELTPIRKDVARSIALADYSGSGSLETLDRLEELPGEIGGAAPVWRAVFDDRDSTTLYIDPDRAEVRSRRSATWRFYDFFWKLHIMDYDDGADFNHPLLVTAAGAGLVAALSGLSLLFIRMRRVVLVERNKRRARVS
ncbi:MAG: PepSY domain-containing protein [Pseudomonadota bacterium]